MDRIISFNVVVDIDAQLLSKRLLPDEITKPGGYNILKKPDKWR